jgi:hypothetical protein
MSHHTVAALVIDPLGDFFCGGNPENYQDFFAFFPQPFLTQVVHYLAMLWYAVVSTAAL